MSIRSPSRSIFRPVDGVDPTIVEESRKLIGDINRRKLLRGTLSLGALTMLTGCSVSDTGAMQALLRAVSALNDGVQELLFRPNHLAPSYSEDQVARPPRFNAYYEIEDVKPVKGETWKLELSGLVDNKAPWSAEQISKLPETEIIVRHICVEGWDYIGQWSGVSMAEFLKRIGADTRAKYISFKCADDYTETLDMATALHPQTILATKYAREPITDPFGFPLRLRTSTKLGFKNAKWITAMEVTNTFIPTFWSKQGFNWFAGI